MEQRTEFPELEAYRGELERQQHEALRQINDAISAGKSDAGAEQWHARISRQLIEVNYILNFFAMARFRQAQGWQPWQTAAVIAVTALALLLSIFAVWRG